MKGTEEEEEEDGEREREGEKEDYFKVRGAQKSSYLR